VLVAELYRHYDKYGCLLYVGISLCTAARLSQHRAQSPWFESIARIEIQRFETREMARRAELHAIRNEQPLFNVAGIRMKRRKIMKKAIPKPVPPKRANRLEEAYSELMVRLGEGRKWP
jgi:hypothetical protein